MIGAFASGTVRTALWTFAVVLIYLARRFNYPLPGRRLSGGQVPAAGEHLAERHRALFVIALGRGDPGHRIDPHQPRLRHHPDRGVRVTFAVIALIWRVYIFRAGTEMGPAIQASARPDIIATLASYAHIVMIERLVVRRLPR